MEPEINYFYPAEWVEEYRRNGTVQCWHDEYRNIFDGSRGTYRNPPGYDRKDNLSTYALMYLLKRDEGVESVSYFRLAAKTPSRDGKREALQEYLRTWMGEGSFQRLQNAIREAGFNSTGFEGEPDLFCWNPTMGGWFFAEAKGDDTITENQRRWFAVCRKALPDAIIKVCRVLPWSSNGKT